MIVYTPLAKSDVTEVPELRAVAERHDATPAQVALAWLLEKPATAAVPKSATPAHIRENYGAVDLELDPADVACIDGIDRECRYVDPEAAPWN